MKWILLLSVWVVPGMAAQSEPLRVAKHLEYVVESLSRDALHESEQCSDPRERRKFLELGEQSQEVNDAVHFRIVSELEKGTPLDEVAEYFEALRSEIQFLQRLSLALRVIPDGIRRLVDDMESTTRTLYRALHGGAQGGVSATCKETVESNIWTGPKTFVTCDFRGRGLVQWEVLLNVGSTKLQGHLYPELQNQHITTEKVRAGLWPKYEVFATDNRGRRTLVAKN